MIKKNIKLLLEQAMEKLGVKVFILDMILFYYYILDNIIYQRRTTEKSSDARSLMKWLKVFGIRIPLINFLICTDILKKDNIDDKCFSVSLLGEWNIWNTETPETP